MKFRMGPYNLPLLIVNGGITCVEEMTVEDLHTFIPFMTLCASKGLKKWNDNQVPVWWCPNVEFKFPLERPAGTDNEQYLENLKSIVRRCYTFNNKFNILRLCTKLAKQRNRIRIVDNGNNTANMYLVSPTTQHLLTFSSQNRTYDQIPEHKTGFFKMPRRQLLPTKEITNIYLCENCDAEFLSYAEITAHERVCYGWPQREKPQSTPSDLLGYLQLVARDAPTPLAQLTPPEISLSTNRLIEFSSVLGRRILQNKVKRDVALNPRRCVQHYEALCCLNQRNGKMRDGYEFRSLYRVSQRNKDSDYHKYYFTRRDKRERYKTLKTGLSTPSRMLLKSMKKCSVRLSRCVIIPAKIPEPVLIDLCSSDDEC